MEAISEKIENTHRHPIVIAGDLNVPEANWKGAVSEAKVQQLVNRLVGEGGLAQVVDRPTRQEALLDVYLIRPQELFLSCDVIEGISDHKAVLVDLDINISLKRIPNGTKYGSSKRQIQRGFTTT